MDSSTRVVVNTGIQYVRTVVQVAIMLYTSRVVLDNLGVEDYGIYNLVGGVIAMLSFIQINLANTTIRYLSYHHGKNDMPMVIKIFNNLKSATTRLYDTEAKIICIVSKKGAQCIECHHKDI